MREQCVHIIANVSVNGTRERRNETTKELERSDTPLNAHALVVEERLKPSGELLHIGAGFGEQYALVGVEQRGKRF